MAAEDCENDDGLKKHRDLLIACGWGKEVDVILLLQQGASVRVQDQDGKNCLHYSACKGHIQVTNLLVQSGCNINAKDKTLRTPLHLASEEGHHDIVSILLDNNVLLDEQDEEGNTPLHVACLNGNIEVIELLVHLKAHLNIKNHDGFTPLHVATINNQSKAMTLLLKAGANKVAQDMSGNTPIHAAISIRSFKALRCLVKSGADVNIQNHDGNSALHLGCDNGSMQLVQYILNAEQSIELNPNNVGDTAKDIAIRHGYREIAQIIPDLRKKIVKRKSHNSESPTSPTASQASGCTPPFNVTSDTTLEVPPSSRCSPRHQSLQRTSPQHHVSSRHKKYNNSSLRASPTYSKNAKSTTSSSMSSLWVPTTDSGISLPVECNGELRQSTRQRSKKIDKNDIFNELRKYDSHQKDGGKYKHQSSKKKEKYKTHEYEELKYDPVFMSPQIAKKNITVRRTYDRRLSEPFFDSGAISDESMQVSGCFFKTNKKKSGPKSPTKDRSQRKHKCEDDELIRQQRKKELYYELDASKHSLEKQMRDMRKKFAKVLLATDERFLEQKKREEAYHYQIKSELELIEQSLDRGSKQNVDEYTQHIKSELGRLAEKLSKGSFESNSSDLTDGSDGLLRVNKRVSAVDLDRQISVSLSDNFNAYGKKKTVTKSKKENQQSVMKIYQKRLKELEKEADEKAIKERENEQLKARVAELEKLIKSNQSSGDG